MKMISFSSELNLATPPIFIVNPKTQYPGYQMNDTQILMIALSTAPTMLIVLVGILCQQRPLWRSE